MNVEKYGAYTPGTWISIANENEFLKDEPDYLIVLPWHLRRFFVANRKWKKVTLVFPLPRLEVA